MKRRPRSRPASAGRLALVATVLAGACAGAPEADRSPGELRGRLLPSPLEKPEFTLADTRGEPFSFRDRTDGRLTLLFFGFTNCPDVCPVHMANLGAVLSRFSHEIRARVSVVFVTTDPDRDSPERMRAWLDRFDHDFIGLRGDIDEINRIQASLGLAAAVRGGDGADGGYTVGHAAQVIAFTPDNRAHVVYPFGTRQDDWLNDMPRLLRADW